MFFSRSMQPKVYGSSEIQFLKINFPEKYDFKYMFPTLCAPPRGLST